MWNSNYWNNSYFQLTMMTFHCILDVNKGTQLPTYHIFCVCRFAWCSHTWIPGQVLKKQGSYSGWNRYLVTGSTETCILSLVQQDYPCACRLASYIKLTHCHAIDILLIEVLNPFFSSTIISLGKNIILKLNNQFFLHEIVPTVKTHGNMQNFHRAWNKC